MPKPKKEAKKRIEKLKKAIRKHRYNYHVLDRETLSPEALDSLKKELFDIEQKFPDLQTPDSPTQRVGGEPLEKFEKAEHPVPMLSFNDAFNEKDLRDWIKRVENYLGYEIKDRSDDGFYCELKFDGLAVELTYESGVFAQGSTRGNGLIGEDVTQNLKTVSSIPLSLEGAPDTPKKLVVRGEVLITKENFKRINKARRKNGEPVYANPRNLAAGTIRQLDPKVVKERRLDFFAYGIVLGVDAKTHVEEHEALNKAGFKTDSHGKKLNNLKEVFDFREKWMKKREKLDYEIDGIVVQINNNDIFQEAGVVGKAPRGAVAFKFPAKEATTKIKDIKVQVGRTGALTPVAVLEPVEVGGITIAHASLHNEDQIRRLGVKIGDTVVVSRAGDVIPQVVKVLKNLRTGKEKSFKMPKKCPVDGSGVKKDGAIIRCSNPKCGARHKEQIYHFVSKSALNIDGVGPKVIDRFLDAGLITDFPDLFELEKGDIAVLEGFGDKSADNIVEELKNKKKIDLPKFIYSLGILHIGEENANLLAGEVLNKLPNKKLVTPNELLRALKEFSEEDLEAINDIGPEITKSVYGWAGDRHSQKLAERLTEVGIRILVDRSKKENKKLKGKKFVLTGTLESLSRGEAKNIIRGLGGKVSGSVSGKTDYLVVGKTPGSKYDKAKKLGVKIIDEKELLGLVGKSKN